MRVRLILNIVFAAISINHAIANTVTMIRVSQESSAGAGDWEQNVLGVIRPWQTSQTPSDFYAYGSPIAASFNGTNITLVEGQCHVFFVQTPAPTNLCLFIVLDRPGGAGGHAKTFVRTVPNMPSLMRPPELEDDTNDCTCSRSQPSQMLQWSKRPWTGADTDGLVYRGIDGIGWQRLSLGFSQPPAAQTPEGCGGLCSDTTSPVFLGLTTWRAYSDGLPNVDLVLAEDRLAFFEPVADCAAVAWPSKLAVCAGETATMQAISPDAISVTYQWRFNGLPLGPASVSASTLVRPNVTVNDAGLYDCIVTKPCGTMTSNAVMLSVFNANGDGDHNGLADGRDIKKFVSAILEPATLPALVCPFDFDGDGTVSVNDLQPLTAVLLNP